MADVFTKKKRSEIMSRIRSKNTNIERGVFKELRKSGVYFYKHYKSMYGNIDIALPKKKRAVFLDGDFWHGYNFNKIKKRLPEKYWFGKIENNIKRDNFKRARLRKVGWKILKIWEHDIENKFEKSILKIVEFLKEK